MKMHFTVISLFRSLTYVDSEGFGKGPNGHKEKLLAETSKCTVILFYCWYPFPKPLANKLLSQSLNVIQNGGQYS